MELISIPAKADVTICIGTEPPYNCTGGSYDILIGDFVASGTSFATPLVASAAALLLRFNPYLPTQVKNALYRGAKNLDDPERFGYGLLDVTKSVELVKASDVNTPVTEVDLPHPPTNLTAKVTGSSVQVNWSEPSMAARTPVGSYFIKITNNDGLIVRTESVALRGTNTFTAATGMAPGHYRVSVVARNQAGDSPEEVATTCVIELEVKNPIAALPFADVCSWD